MSKQPKKGTEQGKEVGTLQERVWCERGAGGWGQML